MALILSSRRIPDEYLVIYALALFTVSVMSPGFHLFAPANLLILVAALLRFLHHRVE